jgi:GrpB-like predicted nucleotidyltransferase (UPF0157 family)
MSGTANIPHERIQALTMEPIVLVPYDERWPILFSEEKARLERTLPAGSFSRIEHIGSPAVHGLSAKPVIDIQVEVASLDRVRRELVPIMEDIAYEFIWRPTMGESAPFYAWFIKRNPAGDRIFHVHMVEPDQASADRILFRDHLRSHPADRAAYEALKHALAARHPDDRAAYTKNKTDHINRVLARAR